MRTRIAKMLPIAAGAAIVCAALHQGAESQAQVARPAAAPANDIAALQAEVARLKSVASDQSHAMVDVGYHFANLWFAGEKKNWPLAKFYFDETRSHIN